MTGVDLSPAMIAKARERGIYDELVAGDAAALLERERERIFDLIVAADSLVYIGDLVQKTEGEMLKTPNFGRKSLNEIKEVLGNMGLKFGMDVPGWPPENIEELARKFEDPY